MCCLRDPTREGAWRMRGWGGGFLMLARRRRRRLGILILGGIARLGLMREVGWGRWWIEDGVW